MTNKIVTELVGQLPPKGEENCWCGKPATVPTEWPGCSHCGGLDCGDTADVDWVCQACYEQIEVSLRR